MPGKWNNKHVMCFYYHIIRLSFIAYLIVLSFHLHVFVSINTPLLKQQKYINWLHKNCIIKSLSMVRTCVSCLNKVHANIITYWMFLSFFHLNLYWITLFLKTLNCIVNFSIDFQLDSLLFSSLLLLFAVKTILRPRKLVSYVIHD